MAKYILHSIEGINWLAIGPLVLFFVFFVVISIIAIKSKKSFIDKMSNMPFDDGLVTLNQEEP